MNTEDIKQVITEVLERLCVPHDSIEVRNDYGRTVYAIYTPDARFLIGLRGEALDSLSFLVRRIAVRRCANEQELEPFGIDVNNYLAKKSKAITDQAQEAARRVRMFQHDVELPPMNAYERMIVHHHLSEVPDIATESTGEGKYRHVVIRLRAKDNTANH